MVTSATRSTPSVPGSSRAASLRVTSSAVPKAPAMAPASRMWRVRRRVSMPVIPGTPDALSHESRSRLDRQFDGRSVMSRTITPRQ